MRILLILNPVAGQSRPGAALPRIQECLSGWATELTVRETTRRGDAEAWAREVQPEQYHLVVAAGGDGTINEVLNGLPQHAALGILPLGTANVLARELGIPVNDLPGACRILRECPPRPVDLGECNHRRFSLMAGIGFDAEAVREVLPNVKDLIGGPAYVLAGLKALRNLQQAPRYRLTFPKRRRRLVARGMMLVIANAASYAGPLRIAAKASIDDGRLDLCLFRERSRFWFLIQWVRVLLRRHLADPHFLYRSCQEVHVECTPPVAVQLDGDYFGTTPVTVRILPGAIRIARP